MTLTKTHLLLAALIALLGVFLCVGRVSADDGSTGTPAAQPTVVATDPSTQPTDENSPGTAASTANPTDVVGTPDATATPDVTAPPDENAVATATPTPVVTTTPADTTTPDTAVTETATVPVDSTGEVTATPQDTTTPDTAITDTATVPVDSTAEATTAPVDTTTPDAAATEIATAGAGSTTDASGSSMDGSLVDGNSSGDPYFTVGAVKYAFETNSTLCPPGTTLGVTCFVSATPITAALNYITTNSLVPTDKKIYIEQGTYTENVSIDGSSSALLSQLVGLIGVDGSALTTLNGSVTVQNTISGFTLQGVKITGNVANGLVTFDGNTGGLQIQDVVVQNTNAAGDGIVVTNQTGTVTLTNVDSSENGKAGAKITTTGNTTINNSSFDRNSGDNSLQVTSTAGSITMNGVSSSRNTGGSGADLKASKGITITYSHFERNTNYTPDDGKGYGVYIEPGTAGTITMNTVFASSNEESNIYLDSVNSAVTLTSIEANSSLNGYGLYIDNCAPISSACTKTVAGAINLANLSVSSNTKSNVYVSSSGSITASNISANYSFSDNGGYFDNRYAKSPQNISISSSDFGYANQNGLVVNTKGSVTLNAILSDGNGNQDGINVDATAGVGTVTILNTLGQNEADSNPRDGLIVSAKGNISVNGIYTDSDQSMGIDLVNTAGTGSVTLNNAELDNDGTATSDYALTIQSKGAISVLNPIIESNKGTGALLSNQTAASAQPVTVTNCIISNNNKDGLIIFSKGNVTVSGNSGIDDNNKTAFNQGGLYIDNTAGSGTVTIANMEVNNNNRGIYILSKGNILLNTVMALDNTNEGAFLNNTASPAATITVNYGTFNSNGSWGLDALAKGTITLTSISTYENNSSVPNPFSVNLDNSTGTGGVVINGTSSAWNSIDSSITGGLNIQTTGAVTMNYIETRSNAGKGININDTGSGTVTLSNAISSNNTAEGIYVIAKGTITLNNPSVTSNQGSTAGVYLHNDIGTGGVVVQGTSTAWGYIAQNHNPGNTAGRELDIKTNGAVTVNYLELDYSPEDGLYIDNKGGTGAVSLAQVSSTQNLGSGAEIFSQGAVTISGYSATSDHSWGLNVSTKGTITLSALSATSDNSTAGKPFCVKLDNSTGTGGVVINGTSNTWNVVSSNPGGGGLNIQTTGPVTINYIMIETNTGGMGLDINDTGSGAVTISNIISTYNSDAGVWVNAKGTITVNNPDVEWNKSASAGIYLHNDTGTGGIVVQGTSVHHGVIDDNHNLADSMGNELNILTNGAVTLSYLDLDHSPVDGIFIDNTGGTGAVSLTAVTSNGNLGSGVNITSHGVVTVTGLNANNNGAYGLYIQNNGGSATAVSLSNVNTNGNHGSGTYILSKGAVTLTGIYSSSNISGGYGVDVDNTSGTGGITLTNTGSTLNSFTSNAAGGVHFKTNGAVVLKNTVASQNVLNGIWVNNASGTGSITLNTVTATSNHVDGIDLTTSGSVTASGVDASHSIARGLYIVNTTGTGGVTITNGIFNSTGSDGLNVLSKGAITLTNVTADSNTSGYAAKLDNSTSTGTPPGVTVQNSGSLMNYFEYSKWGLDVLTRGAVVLGNIEAYNNANTAIAVDNTSGTAGVTLTNIKAFSFSGTAVDVETKGAVTGSNLSSAANGTGYAILIDNCQLTSACIGSGNVTLTTVTAADGVTGLRVLSNGTISVSNLNASNNGGGYGAYLDNSHSSVAGSVSVLSANASYNKQDGIHIVSRGSVTLDGITAMNNYTSAYGVYVDNSALTGNVSVLNTKGANTFTGNSLDGLCVTTQGTITVTGATASNNGRYGLFLNTSGSGKTITLTKVTTSHNYDYGIVSTSHGAETFTNIQAFDNGDNTNYDGINVTTNGYDFTISNSYISGNGKNGINATVGGLTHNVKVIKSFYFGNGQYGGVDAPDIVTDGKLVFA